MDQSVHIFRDPIINMVTIQIGQFQILCESKEKIDVCVEILDDEMEQYVDWCEQVGERLTISELEMNSCPTGI